MQIREYGPFPYSAIPDRAPVSWPNGARVAVWVIPNLEFFPLSHGLSGHPFESRGPAPTVRPWAQRDYGNRVGIWRIMDVLQRFGIRASATMNADLCDFHPRIVEAGLALGWEFLGHNKTNTQRLSGLAVEEERELIHSSLARIAQATGRKPAGWLGAALAETWNTLDILIEEGVGYVADWTNDDQPYVMSTESGKIVSIPYSYELNDSPFFYYRNGTPDEFEAMIKRQFDVLYEEGSASGRVMAICLHPFIIGVPHRIRALQGALSYICNHHQVWFATGEEIVGHYCREVAPELLR